MITVFASDIHFPAHHPQLWKNFKAFVQRTKPQQLILGGDILDLGMLSNYIQGAKDPFKVLPQIKMAVREINELCKSSKEVYVVAGNHDERWQKAILGPHAQKLEGMIGLTLQEQLRAQGLHDKVEWLDESPQRPGLILNGVLLAKHGHKQASRFGAIHLSAKLLNAQPTITTVEGHHHRAQLAVRTYFDRQVFGIANPHMSGHHDYNTMPNWQIGFTVIEWIDRKTFCPYIVIADKRGRFSYGGRVYG